MGDNITKVIAKAEKQISDLLGEEIKIFADVTGGGDAKNNEIRYNVLGKNPDKNGITASFSLAQLPGCCGVCVSYHASVAINIRRKGLGTLLCSIRKDIARALGYGCMLCTDVVKNEPQQRILVKNGWKEVHTFRNPRTWNDVNIHVVNLY